MGAGQLEAVEPPGLDVAKVTGITAAVITQLVRLAGLTHEVSAVVVSFKHLGPPTHVKEKK